MTLIAADNLFALAAAVVAGAAFAFWAEGQRWGRQVSGPVWAILFGLVLSNLRVIPSGSAVFAMVGDLLVPAAIPLLLFKANLRRIVEEGGPMLLAFAIGVVGATAGAVIGFLVLPLGAERAELAGVFTATYTGGSMNFVAVAKSVGFSESSQYAAAMAADNLVGTPYLLVLVLLPALGWVRRAFPSAIIADPAKPVDVPDVAIRGSVSVAQLTSALALSLVVCAAGAALAEGLGLGRFQILFITAIAVALANVAPRKMASSPVW